MHVVNLQDCLTRFSTHWDPEIVGELNGQGLVRSMALPQPCPQAFPSR